MPHYNLPFICVTPQGEIDVYNMPTDDALATHAFFKKHQKRINDMIAFIHEHYQLAKNAREPIALLFDDIEMIARHKKIKRICLHLAAHKKIEASIPVSVSFGSAFSILMQYHDWAVQALAKVSPPHQETGIIKVWGKEYRLEISVSTELPAVTMLDDRIYVHLQYEGQPIEEILQPWYISLLKAQLKDLLEEYLPKMEVKIRVCRIIPMTSRWGSYSANTRSISINAKLIEFSPRCLRGVLIHELCHFFVHGHGPDFYRLLERFSPDWREIRKELKEMWSI